MVLSINSVSNATALISGAWGYYFGNSLLSFITTGTGKPERKKEIAKYSVAKKQSKTVENITANYIIEFVRGNEFTLKSTQPKLCVPIIRRICKKMMKGIKFDDIKICNDLIVDGHHRYVSSKITGCVLGSVPSSKTSATIKHEWIEIEFDEIDWDTASKISYLNEQDAKFNNVSIEILRQITS
jgi:hypothetical protein